MGILAQVYRSTKFGDSSNGGISATADTVCVVNADGPFEPSADVPAVIVAGRGNGTMTAYPAGYHAEEGWVVDTQPGKIGPMDGGTFIASADSRFRRLTGFYGAVAFHDRYETQDTYNFLSS